ncbi:MAG: hypothetical protein AABX16_02895, partial [Nanoarchaeota archaeon]
ENNTFYNNTFTVTGINDLTNNRNKYCLNGVGNIYLEGATGPTCPLICTPSIEICDGKDNDCDELIDEICNNDDVNTLTINSPSQELFNNKKIQFNLTLNQTMDKLTYIDLSDSRPREKVLCNKNCNGYGNDKRKLVSFKDGNHTLRFRAVKNNIIDERNVSFLIDSTNPKISKSEPKRGTVNGTFKIEFIEQNPQDLFFFYELNKIEHSIKADYHCVIDRNKNICDVTVDLSLLHGQEINYWFELTDIAGNRGISRKNKIKVI